MRADGFEDFPAKPGLGGRRERGNVSAPAEADRLLKRGHEDLTVGTSPQVLTDLLTEGNRQLIIQEGGQAPEYFQALGLGMSVMGMNWGLSGYHGPRSRMHLITNGPAQSTPLDGLGRRSGFRDAPRTKFPSHEQSGSMQAGLHGTFVEPHDRAHLFGGQPLHIPQHQH